MWEDGPFEIRSLRLSVHQDLCEEKMKKYIISCTAGEYKNDTYKARLHSEKHTSEFKIKEWTYFESWALCQVSAMAYAGITVEDGVSPVNYICRNIPTALKLSFFSCLFSFPTRPQCSRRHTTPVVTLNLLRGVRLCPERVQGQAARNKRRLT